MTFTVLIVNIEQNEEFQEPRVHYTLAGIKSLLKIGEGGSLAREGGGQSGTPGTFPWLRPFVWRKWHVGKSTVRATESDDSLNVSGVFPFCSGDFRKQE